MPVDALIESLSFHNSPESFISSRLAEIARKNPQQLPSGSSTTVVRASILNRNVHVITDNDLCHQVLGSNQTSGDDGRGTQDAYFHAQLAYKDFMVAFFPRPNLLLEDGSAHHEWKERWQRQVQGIPNLLPDLLKPSISGFVTKKFGPDSIIDIYDNVKDLVWQMLFTTFLGSLSDGSSENQNKLHAEMEELQEKLLRGQFSTFPVNVRVPFWGNARNRGINARVKLQQKLKQHYSSLRQESTQSCPLLAGTEIADTDDIANHALMFTSGLANKALASLITSSILNVFFYRASSSSSNLAHLLRSMTPDSPERAKMLRSILLETERLSPPVVGVLRRALQDCPLQLSSESESPYVVPRGHEAWLYFPSASRSHAVFGKDAELFRWDRFMHLSPDQDSPQISLAFGAGPKTCLGRDVSRKIVELVVSGLLDSGLDMDPVPGSAPQPGLQAMLGWITTEDAGGVGAMARDLKQLPTQRARRPVLARILKPS